MIVKGIVDEDLTNYKKPAMLIATARCTFKCDVLNGCKICQNSHLINKPDIGISNKELIDRYLSNSLTSSVVVAGLEPLDQFSELISFIKDFREVSNDDIVIYTGYTDSEVRLTGQRQILCTFPNIVVKYGRFIKDRPHHIDDVLGVELASENQYAERIS